MIHTKRRARLTDIDRWEHRPLMATKRYCRRADLRRADFPRFPDRPPNDPLEVEGMEL